mmetsp:Transcript_11430/g.18807  ORF Transcript_11430/g.18807 Transcript_11430/m.18807 type:complete len:121 (+) Transcript_11430:1516-1878(+)
MPRRERKFVTQRERKKQGGPNKKLESTSEVFSHKVCKVAYVGVKRVRHQGEQAECSHTEDNYQRKKMKELRFWMLELELMRCGSRNVQSCGKWTSSKTQHTSFCSVLMSFETLWSKRWMH